MVKILEKIWFRARRLISYLKKVFFQNKSPSIKSQKKSQPNLDQVIIGNENKNIGMAYNVYMSDGKMPSSQREKRPDLNIQRALDRKVWGRDSLIDQIINQFKTVDRIKIVSLSGSAGYGKTEVARQIAFSVLEKNFFDEVLWVTAREAELFDGVITQDRSNSLNWKQFIYELSIQLDCTNEYSKVQSCILEKPYLIILDNAETADMEDILSKSKRMLDRSCLLLTTRRKVNQDVLDIQCPGLTEESSYQLLQYEARLNKVEALLNASNQELQQIYELSCGAPLALHFVVSRVGEDRELKPVLSSLEQADRNVETFYEFTLKSGWDRISECSKRIMHYMGDLNASIPFNELEKLGLSDSEVRKAENELRRWFFILQINDSTNGNTHRYDLHPWMRRSLRSGLVGDWQESFETVQQIFRAKYGLLD